MATLRLVNFLRKNPSIPIHLTKPTTKFSYSFNARTISGKIWTNNHE